MFNIKPIVTYPHEAVLSLCVFICFSLIVLEFFVFVFVWFGLVWFFFFYVL